MTNASTLEHVRAVVKNGELVKWPARFMICGFVFAALCAAFAPSVGAHAAKIPDAKIRGYAIASKVLYTWGDRLIGWDLPGLHSHVLARGRFGEGGCLVDVDGDGVPDVVATEIEPRPALVWFHAPDGARHVIDSGVESSDVIALTLLGRRGVLLIHKRQQLRFYEVPADLGRAWAETDIYSIYTPSQEGGLAIADVNGDGLPDIFAGNYWLMSPTEFDLPWREFAIDLWNDEPLSAMLRVSASRAAGLGERVAAQREKPRARFAWFEKPDDPKQLWIAHPIAPDLGWNAPDFTLIGRDLLVTERGGQNRVVRLHREQERWVPHELARVPGALSAVTFGDRVLVIARDRLKWLPRKIQPSLWASHFAARWWSFFARWQTGAHFSKRFYSVTRFHVTGS